MRIMESNGEKQMKDLSFGFDSADNSFAFVPHSGRGDAFLKKEFAAIGDHDLTQSDAVAIWYRAREQGLIVQLGL